MSCKQRYKPGKSPFATIPGARWIDYLPDFIEPCHPTQHARAPSGDRWVHEIKVEATAASSTSGTALSRPTRGEATIGPTASARLQKRPKPSR